MDSALVLKMEFDKGIVHRDEVVDDLLSSSELIHSLTSEFSKHSLFPIWRLIALSEIPYGGRLKYTQDLITYVENTYGTSEGFSITGKSEALLPCYNAMLVEAFSKLGYSEKPVVRNAVAWIMKYQVFERNKPTLWKGTGIKKYGGCLKLTPCYIGVAKSIKALIYYTHYSNVKNDQIDDLIRKGMNYLLEHQLYQRLSNDEPITKHILDIAYPQSYQLNIIELLEIAYMTNSMNNPEVKLAVDYIESKRIKGSGWKINYIYKADGYVSFDKRGKNGQWISYLLEKYLSQLENH